MATPKQREAFNDAVAKIVTRLHDSPDQASYHIVRLMNQYDIHATDLAMTANASDASDASDSIMEKWRRENVIMERHQKLREAVGYGCPWADFFKACARKVNVDEAWRGKIATVVGARDGLYLSYNERHLGSVPYEWLEKVMAMPDLNPEDYTPRSNYAEVCEPLESTLRMAGKSSVWIANTLSKFLASFTGTKVTLADVRLRSLKSKERRDILSE